MFHPSADNPKTLLFASHNHHKAMEINTLLGNSFLIKNLNDLNILEEIEENGFSYQENAFIKAHYLSNKTGLPVFSEDSGLEIESLNYAPGIYSARYSGTRDTQNNIQKVLQEMEGYLNRKARFISVFCFVHQDKKYFFEGQLEGTILKAPKGQAGFGYDPIFKPVGFSKSLAEISIMEKNQISHRTKALRQFIEFLDRFPLS